MIVVATDTAWGNRDISKHRYRTPDVCRIEKLRIAGRAKPLKMFGLLAGKQVRLRDRIVGSEKQTESDPRFFAVPSQIRAGTAQEAGQRRRQAPAISRQTLDLPSCQRRQSLPSREPA